MSTENTENSELIGLDILDGSIDDLADLQEYKPWPAGSYNAIFSWEVTKINDAPVVKFVFKNPEVLELADPEAEVPRENSSTSISAFLLQADGSVNENGQGLIKLVSKGLQDTFGGESPREVLDNAAGGKVAVTFKVTSRTKDGETNYYQKLVMVTAE